MRQRRLTITQLLAYGLPSAPVAVLGFPLYVYLPTFYADDVGVALWLVGLVLWGARIFDVITDPLIGIMSDRVRLPGGRRIPWMVLGSPVLLLGCYFLFIPQPGADAWYLLLWSLVTYLGWTMVVLPLSALGAELSSDYYERTRVTSSREGFLIIGTVSSVLLAGYIQTKTGSTSEALKAVYLLLAIMLPVTLLCLIWKVRETKRVKQEQPSFKEGWALMRDNKHMRRILLAYIGNAFANGLPATLFILFCEHILHASREQAAIATVLYFMTGMFALPFWLRLSKGREKHRVWAVSLILVACIFMGIPFLGEGDFYWYLAICFGVGIGLGVDVALPASIQADVIDADTAAGGGDRAGLFFALWGMATKLSLAMAVGIAFGLLALVGFDAKADENSQEALWMLTFLYGVLAVIIKFAVAKLMWNFELGSTEQAALREKITTTVTP